MTVSACVAAAVPSKIVAASTDTMTRCMETSRQDEIGYPEFRAASNSSDDCDRPEEMNLVFRTIAQTTRGLLTAGYELSLASSLR
jgi:hypothetical protein